MKNLAVNSLLFLLNFSTCCLLYKWIVSFNTYYSIYRTVVMFGITAKNNRIDDWRENDMNLNRIDEKKKLFNEKRVSRIQTTTTTTATKKAFPSVDFIVHPYTIFSLVACFGHISRIFFENRFILWHHTHTYTHLVHRIHIEWMDNFFIAFIMSYF